MPDDPPNLRPVQVFLTTDRFLVHEEPQEFRGGPKDFFKNDDSGFAAHKARLLTHLRGAADELRRKKRPVGFLKVSQRDDALAKSHRPLGYLFTRAHQCALVGADGIGESLFQSTPAALDRLSSMVEQKAEVTPRIVRDSRTGDLVRRASGYRCELGAVGQIGLYGASDRVSFSATEAVSWMRDPNTVGGYVVELFRPDPSVASGAVQALIDQFRDDLSRLSGGLIVRPILPATSTAHFGRPSLTLSVKLLRDPSERFVKLPFLPDGHSAEMEEEPLPGFIRTADPDLDPGRHADVLSMLAEQSLVRLVDLPPVLESTPATAVPAGEVEVPPPVPDIDYPTLGLIDGGIASVPLLSSWKAGDAGLVPVADRDESHGTFIAGLVACGAALNPNLASAIEAVGCKVFDLDLFPRHGLRGTYYRDIEELFDLLEEKVKVGKRDYGARVFNLSFKLGLRSSRLGYSLTADRLDRIACSNDVVFVVSAGNLDVGQSRPPWPKSEDQAVRVLAALGSQDHQIVAPADHLLGITVGAINPPGVPGHAELLPTTYTRRGPGVGGARKPDLAHFGGTEPVTGGNTGLRSLSVNGQSVFGHGTSYASPLVAATVATLDHRLANVAPRETLIALPIHRAKRSPFLCGPALRHIARDFVGFGLAPGADAALNDDPHSITLLFHERLLEKQQLDFVFAWPQSLVRASGACRGRADVTLVFTPPLDRDHEEEALRLQLEAHLHQENRDVETGQISWQSRLAHDSANVPQILNKTEKYLIMTGLKWSPIKRYAIYMRQGRGNSSNWRLSLNSLVRAGAAFPGDGVPFTLLLTISDPEGKAAVREPVRADLVSRGLLLADITIAHQVRGRI